MTRQGSEEKFRVHGTLLSEARSAPPGAFEIAGTLTVSDEGLLLRRSGWGALRPPVEIPFDAIVKSELGPNYLYVEWDGTGDGIVSGLRLELSSADEWTRLTRSLEGRVGGAPSA